MQRKEETKSRVVTLLRGRSQSEPMTNTRGLGSQLKGSILVTEFSASRPFERHDLLQKGFSCSKMNFCPVILLNYQKKF